MILVLLVFFSGVIDGKRKSKLEVKTEVSSDSVLPTQNLIFSAVQARRLHTRCPDRRQVGCALHSMSRMFLKYTLLMISSLGYIYQWQSV